MLRWTGGRTFTGHLFGSREEMRLVMQESSQGLTSEERVMINRVLDLQNVTIQQVTHTADPGRRGPDHPDTDDRSSQTCAEPKRFAVSGLAE